MLKKVRLTEAQAKRINALMLTTWAPGLNKKGNSKLGMLALEAFTTKTKLSVF